MGSPKRDRPLDTIDLRVAARLRSRRQQLQVDPRLLDIVIGEPAGTVARFEAGERRIPAAHLFRLGLALNVDVPYFFKETAAETEGPGDDTANNQDPGKPDAGGDNRQEPAPLAPQMIIEADQLSRMYRRLPSRHLRGLVLRLIKSIAARKPDSK